MTNFVFVVDIQVEGYAEDITFLSKKY
jgi:hypothetical protein